MIFRKENNNNQPTRTTKLTTIYNINHKQITAVVLRYSFPDVQIIHIFMSP